jgi:hypothetical protein
MLRRTGAVAIAVLCLAAPSPRPGHAAEAAPAQPFAVEYYYKIAWGHFGEWMQLYERNHYPILKRLQEQGQIVEMRAAYPRYHAGEGSRWDFRFTIVWKDAVAAHQTTDPAIARELYPDQERFEKEEQRRFELLLEHMDVPVIEDDMASW